MKRALDLLLCLLVLPIVLPLGLLCTVAIKLDSRGPVLFAQERTGQHGTRFRMYKFRTMVENAEELKANLQHLSVVAYPDFKILDDPRMTRVGKILRKTSLDELPQLLNLVKGDMSFVGPRPTSFSASTYDLWHTHRLEVRPGITGLWQVWGRNSTSFDERLRLDIQYIQNMSLGLDLRILWRTIASVVRGSGA